jgi:hypothetical protein
MRQDRALLRAPNAWVERSDVEAGESAVGGISGDEGTFVAAAAADVSALLHDHAVIDTSAAPAESTTIGCDTRLLDEPAPSIHSCSDAQRTRTAPERLTAFCYHSSPNVQPAVPRIASASPTPGPVLVPKAV